MKKNNIMTPCHYAAITDANQNRAAEGLRVIEDYCRFHVKHKVLTDQLASARKRIHHLAPQLLSQLQVRDTSQDQRAKEPPASRKDISDLLTANFKRVTEALRVLEEYTEETGFNELRYDVYELEKEVLLRANKPSIKHGIYLISADPETLKKGLEWGVSLIQYRDNTASKERVYNVCKQLQVLASEANIPMIVNNFLDIAVLLDADGLHTGQDDLSVNTQRQIFGEHKLIGKTTHNPEQGQKAQAEGADYVSVGPIWETPSKPGRAAIGMEYLSTANDILRIPYVAIGGIETKDRFDQVSQYNPPLTGIVRAAEHIPEWYNGTKEPIT